MKKIRQQTLARPLTNVISVNISMKESLLLSLLCWQCQPGTTLSIQKKIRFESQFLVLYQPNCEELCRYMFLSFFCSQKKNCERNIKFQTKKGHKLMINYMRKYNKENHIINADSYDISVIAIECHFISVGLF